MTAAPKRSSVPRIESADPAEMHLVLKARARANRRHVQAPASYAPPDPEPHIVRLPPPRPGVRAVRSNAPAAPPG